MKNEYSWINEKLFKEDKIKRIILNLLILIIIQIVQLKKLNSNFIFEIT